MLTWRGKQQAGPGTYWDMETGERVEIKDQEMLPGDRSTRYIRASSAAVLLFGPVLGVMYAVFLPFAGIAMTMGFVGRKAVSAGKKTARRMVNAAAKNIYSGWRPLQAYFISKRKGGKKVKDAKRTMGMK